MNPLVTGPYSPEKPTGLFGGTFDPIHLGHLGVARSLLAAARVEQVIFIPAACSPFKTDARLTADHHRLEMVNIAIQDQPGFCSSAFEIQQGGISYTIGTAAAFAAILRQPPIIIVGADAVGELHRWRAAQTLVEQYRFLIYDRPGVVFPERAELERQFGKPLAAKLESSRVTGEMFSVSATAIRSMLNQGKEASGLLPAGVIAYIRHHRLYEFDVVQKLPNL